MDKFQAEHISALQNYTNTNAAQLHKIRRRSQFFHSQVNRLVSSQVQSGSSVLDVGCGDGQLIATMEERISTSIGIDLDEQALVVAQKLAKGARFIASPIEAIDEPPLENPDYIVLSMVLDQVYDVYSILERVSGWAAPHTRLILVTYSRLWRPILRLAELLHLKAPNPKENYVPRVELANLLELSGFEVTKSLDGVLIPFWIPFIARFVNRWIAPLPLIRHLCLVQVTVARARKRGIKEDCSVSIVIAARNEEGHIPDLIRRTPIFGSHQEIIFVEGGSTDGTWNAIQDELHRHKPNIQRSIQAHKQTGVGKGDAVRKGFAQAQGDILMILDADLSVPPEELPRFYEALVSDSCEFANGSRLVYPMENGAMRFLNILGNKVFSQLFSFLLGQPVRDTLCGTKVVRRSDYERLISYRAQFQNLDPFGDFDLLFSASAKGLRIRDIPVHYKERKYGTTNISRFSHGFLLLRMSRLAASKLKFIG